MIKVQNELKPYHEIGKRFASELRPGNIEVSGYAERAHVNGAMIKLLLGDGAVSPPPSGSLAQPGSNLVINLSDPATPGNAQARPLRREVRQLELRPPGGRLRHGGGDLQGAAHRQRGGGRVRLSTPGARVLHARSPPLTADELLAGAAALFEVEVPAEVLRPAADGAAGLRWARSRGWCSSAPSPSEPSSSS